MNSVVTVEYVEHLLESIEIEDFVSKVDASMFSLSSIELDVTWKNLKIESTKLIRCDLN